MTALARINLLLAALALAPTTAHVMELPNKLSLDGPLWLGVQQHLYRGWGPFFGAPVEIAALITSLVLAALRRRDRETRTSTFLAVLAYIGMLASFFAFDGPVNAALSGWTPATIPADWRSCRVRWESGHALACLFALVALIALVRAWPIDRDRTPRPEHEPAR